jgi:hypothetical protein
LNKKFLLMECIKSVSGHSLAKDPKSLIAL